MNMTKAIELIAAERQRGIKKEKYDATHDDEHVAGHLAQGGIAYATAFIRQHNQKCPDLDFVRQMHWPFEKRTWKPGDRMRNLIKAGAMIAAELDRELRESEHANLANTEKRAEPEISVGHTVEIQPNLLIVLARLEFEPDVIERMKPLIGKWKTVLSTWRNDTGEKYATVDIGVEIPFECCLIIT